MLSLKPLSNATARGGGALAALLIAGGLIALFLGWDARWVQRRLERPDFERSRMWRYHRRARAARVRSHRARRRDLAAAQLKRVIGSAPGAQSLTAAGCEKLAVAEGIFLGVDVARLLADAQRCLREDGDAFPRIVLHLPA